MDFFARNRSTPPPPPPHGVSPRYCGWLMNLYPDEMLNYEVGHGGPDPKHVLRHQYENEMRQWRSHGSAVDVSLNRTMLVRAETLMGARTVQGSDGRSYWVGSQGGLEHRLSIPTRKFYGNTGE